MYASKITKIVDLHQIQDSSPSASMVVQIVKSLPRPYEYVVYLDNLFSSIDLFMSLNEQLSCRRRGRGWACRLVWYDF